jgi:hypothetical protein
LTKWSILSTKWSLRPPIISFGSGYNF